MGVIHKEMIVHPSNSKVSFREAMQTDYLRFYLLPVKTGKPKLSSFQFKTKVEFGKIQLS